MRRDKEYLRELLKQLQDEPDGYVLFELLLNPSAEELKFDHHIDLLMDEGLVARKGQHGYRLTPLGHDAAEMLEKNSTWEVVKTASPKESYEFIKNLGSTLAVAAISRLMGWG